MAEDPRSQDAGQANRNTESPAVGSEPHPTENIIRPARRRRAEPEETREAGDSDRSERRGSRRRSPNANRQVPEHIKNRFVQVGHRYYFKDGAHAFSDRGSRLITTSENTEVVKSLIVIAEERGWRDVTVSGTERFRREAWAVGTAAGLNVRGYTPTEFDREQLARRSAREATDRVAETPLEPFDPTRPKEDQRRREMTRRRELTVGRLVDHGPSPYRHDPHEPMSYFVRVETEEGEREVWGVDLERAIKKSLTQVKRGDEIGLRAVRREAVSVPSARRDEEGRVVGQDRLDVHRNHWIVERRDFFEERAAAARTLRDPAIDAKRGARQHQELVGTYLQVHAAEIAARQFRDAEDRQKFVARVRSALADAVARGEPLAPVRLRDRAATATPQSPAREDALVR
jgi:Large polyvalent protein-associated domain 7